MKLCDKHFFHSKKLCDGHFCQPGLFSIAAWLNEMTVTFLSSRSFFTFSQPLLVSQIKCDFRLFNLLVFSGARFAFFYGFQQAAFR